MAAAKPALDKATLKNQEVNRFMSQVWFFLFYFILLVVIASFGIIAEV